MATALTREAEDPIAVDPRFWLGFGRVPYVGPARIGRLLERFGDLERAWAASAAELRQVLDERSLESLLRTRRELDLDREYERIRALGIDVVTQADPSYPRLLAEIPAPPPVLYVKGELRPEDDAVSTYRTDADREWARKWPMEHIWKVRRRRDEGT